MTQLKPPTKQDAPDSDVSLVINRTALIENLLNQIIVGFCRPHRDAWPFMWNIVLDTSVMSLGAKVKVAMAIAGQLKTKLDRQSLHRVLELRNAFAHHSTTAHPVLNIGLRPEEDSIDHHLWILEGSGNTKRTTRKAALAEFSSSYQSAKKSCVAFTKALEAKVPPSVA